MYDLTNYPYTLTERDLDKIKPDKFFGKIDQQKDQTLVSAKFIMKDPQLCNIGDDFVNG